MEKPKQALSLKPLYSLILSTLLISCASSKDFSLYDGKFEVQLTEYNHKNSDKSKRIVFIVPPTGGTNLIDRSYAKKLSRAGIKTVIINNWTRSSRRSIDLEYHYDFYHDAQKAIDLTINKYQSFSPSLLGTSIGAMHAAITIGRIKNIESAFLIVGGGDIAGIIANSDQDAMVDLKQKRFEKFNYSHNDEYIHALERVLPYEPLKLKKHKNQKIGMVLSEVDQTVPYENQKRLSEYLKPMKVIIRESSHKTTVIKTWLFDSGEVVDFFTK